MDIFSLVYQNFHIYKLGQMEFLMKVELNGQEIETTDTGFLVNLEDWNEDIAKVIAALEEI